MQKEKKQYIVSLVMAVDPHEKMYREKMPRSRAAKHVGAKHVSVGRHRFSSFPNHWHDFFELEYVVSGSAMHTHNGKEYTSEKGQLYFLTQIDFHGFQGTPEVELINIKFDETRIPEYMNRFAFVAEQTKIRQLDPQEQERFEMAAKLLAHECKTGGSSINALLEYLLNFICKDEGEKTVPSEQQEQLVGVRNALAYMERHFREALTLEQLSELAGYTPTYFSGLFTKVTGETYTQRLQTLRVNYARVLLMNGMSVEEACFKSGFGSLSNFLTVFRKRCGVSPGEFRKLCREDSAK